MDFGTGMTQIERNETDPWDLLLRPLPVVTLNVKQGDLR